MSETALAPQPLRFKSAFVSHAGEDKELALELVRKLEARGCQCWVSARDIPPGANWDYEVMQGLKKSEVIILLLTEHANKSKYVEMEVFHGRTADKLVLPIRFGSVTPSERLAFWLASQQLLEAPHSVEGLEKLLPQILYGRPLTPGGDPPPGPVPPQRSTAKPFLWGLAVAALVAGAWYAGREPWKTRPEANSTANSGTSPTSPPATATPAPTAAAPIPAPAPAKLGFFTQDGKPLEGAVLAAEWAPSRPSFENGVVYKTRTRSLGGPLTHLGHYALEYRASESDAIANGADPGGIIVDSSETITTGEIWKQVIRVPNAGREFTHYSLSNDTSTLLANPSAGSDLDLYFSVGRKGSIPAGRHQVHLIYGSEPNGGGNILAEATFYLELPPKLVLLTENGTTPLNGATVEGFRIPDSEDISHRPLINGVAVQLKGGSKVSGTTPGAIELQYTATESKAIDATKPVSGIMVDSSVVTTPGSSWEQVFALPKGQKYTHYSLFNDTPGLLEGAGTQAIFYVGKGGSIPPGQYPVRLLYKSLTRGNEVLAEATFTLNIPPPAAPPASAPQP